MLVPVMSRNPELTRMALAGLGSVMMAKVKALAESVIREFDGSPEQLPEFQEAQFILPIIADIEAGP